MHFLHKRIQEPEPQSAPVGPGLVSELHQLVIERLEDDSRGLLDDPLQLRQRVRELIEETLKLRGYARSDECLERLVEGVWPRAQRLWTAGAVARR